jgi:hypothetical protein
MLATEKSSYELELVLGGDPSTALEATYQSTGEVQEFVTKFLVPNSVLTVAHLRGGADLGNFIIFANDAGLAHVRLLEHRGFYAKRSSELTTGRQVQFISDVGSLFEVDEVATVQSGVAVEALNYWLNSGAPLPSINWGEE